MSELFDFLNDKKEEEKQSLTDWDKVKSDWLSKVDKFMKDIHDWLGTKEREGVIEIVHGKTIIAEEHMGSYEAPFLVIRIGTSEVKIAPIGRLIIGATGRIDIISFADRIIILNDAKRGWIYREPLHSNRYLDFNAENFAGILKEVLYEN